MTAKNKDTSGELFFETKHENLEGCETCKSAKSHFLTKTETMTSPLQSYFTTLAKELNVELEATVVEPDNARTIKGSFDESLLGSSAEMDEHISRWMESSSSSDVSLCIPGRRSSIECTSLGDSNGTKETYREPVICGTERWLKELPTDSEGLPNDEIPISPYRVCSFDDDIRMEDSDTNEEIPRLKGCRFATDEKYPVSKLLEISQEGLIQSPMLWEDDDNDKPASLDWREDAREDTSTYAAMQQDVFVKRGNRVTCKNDVDIVKSKTKYPASIHRQKRHFDAFEKDVSSSLLVDRKASFE